MLIKTSLANNSVIRQKIRDYYRINETQVVEHILPEAEVSMLARSRAWERARTLVLRIRKEQEGHGGVDALLNEYSLSSEEGVVLMCLAEALLRVPDKHTQDELIRDKLASGQWSSHLGNSDSLFVNAAAWGLMFTGNMVNYANERKQAQFGLLKKTMGRMGEPVIRRAMNIAMKVMGKQFVMGETIEDAVKRAQEKERNGYVYSYDMLGEGARTFADADRYFKAYADAIEVIGKAGAGKGPRLSPGISVKLSAIHPRYDYLKYEKVVPEICERLKKLCMQAKKHNIGLTVDAEESERLEISLDIIENVFSDPDLGDWQGFGIAVQSYQKRAIYVIEWLREITTRVNKKMMVRLVKGAYWDTEIKHTQQGGHDDFPVFTRKASTDVSYHACANRLLAYRDSIYPQFATHNAYTASVILELAGTDKEGFEFQCLHGMGDTLYDQIVKEEKIQCRVYAPVGQHEDLLAYLVRRLLENGANSSFVNAIVDDTKPVEELLSDPVEHTQRLAKRVNTQITMPIDLYGESRANSKGFDVYDINKLSDMSASIDKWFDAHCKTLKGDETADFIVRNPADVTEIVGYHNFDSPEKMLEKLNTANNAFASWSATAVEERAKILMGVADILERHMDELIGLCIKEAGKITEDSVDEVREAVDFARYYAVEAQTLDPQNRLEPRGVILCISPWNFPLAIFLGQVVAALATGNTVVAKPAEQTSLIAIRALELMHSVGVPKGVLQLVIAKGPEVGDTLLPDERIQGVMFTGSTQTGTLIARALAQRTSKQVPLIAETGGQNCMIVDSTALPEQVVDDVVMSGFRSAGQRCSALRVLFVQDVVADDIIEMIIGAMKELSVGDPQWLSTDLGPVIDEKALKALTDHEAFMQENGKLLYKCEVDNDLNGTFFAPHLFEISDLSVLTKEVFGPCVHVVRFKGNELNKVMDQINATGYGLTMGIHTRIEERAYELAKLSRAGNLYINRNMIGAIVGVQPFGGRGLSGTGPKAGGPNYLPRLMMEKVTPELAELDGTEQSFGGDEALLSDSESSKEVGVLIASASKVVQEWRLTSLISRLSSVRQLLAKIATIESVEELADDLNSTLASARSQLLSIEKRLKKPQVLPGPTGESNTLHLEPRGILVTFADKEVAFEYWTLSIVTALATGNVVVAVVSDLFYEEALTYKEKFESTGAPKGVFQVARLKHLEALLEHQDIAGMIVDSSTSRTARFVKKMALRQGAILPVITAEHNDNMIGRLVTEKTISIDTTASGGNTSLMTMTEDDD